MASEFDNKVRSQVLHEIRANTERTVALLKSAPPTLDRDAGGPETTLALRKAQELVYWLRMAEEMARVCGE